MREGEAQRYQGLPVSVLQAIAMGYIQEAREAWYSNGFEPLRDGLLDSADYIAAMLREKGVETMLSETQMADLLDKPEHVLRRFLEEAKEQQKQSWMQGFPFLLQALQEEIEFISGILDPLDAVPEVVEYVR